MGDPTLAQLLNFFRTNPLPEEPGEDYAAYTVESLSPCGADDSPTYRMLGYPDDPENVLFLPPDEIASPDAFFFRAGARTARPGTPVGRLSRTAVPGAPARWRAPTDGPAARLRTHGTHEPAQPRATR